MHPAHIHPVRDPADAGGWVGVDLGLSAFVVAADAVGTELGRFHEPPKALAAGMKR